MLKRSPGNEIKLFLFCSRETTQPNKIAIKISDRAGKDWFVSKICMKKKETVIFFRKGEASSHQQLTVKSLSIESVFSYFLPLWLTLFLPAACVDFSEMSENFFFLSLSLSLSPIAFLVHLERRVLMSFFLRIPIWARLIVFPFSYCQRIGIFANWKWISIGLQINRTLKKMMFCKWCVCHVVMIFVDIACGLGEMRARERESRHSWRKSSE